jgi:acid stress-induced BolA-like protein IbaG/YrbA
MQPEEVKAKIEAGIPGAEVSVKSDGSHYEVTVISEAFDGKTRLKKEQMVNGTLINEITSGAIHALNIRPYTPAEWATASKLQVS